MRRLTRRGAARTVRAMLLRSLLFAPANHARRVGKALSLAADAVILDLEDAVAVSEKAAARADAAAACALPRRGRLFIRVNALSTPWALADLLAVVRPGLDGIVLPKVEDAGEMATAEWLLAAIERDAGLPAGVQALPAIAAAARRARRLAFGAADFTADTGLHWTREEAELAPYRAQCVLASRAAGLEAPVDTVWTALDDAEGFAASVERVRVMGFGGKLCIHPDQIAAANAAFAPSAAQVERARRVAAAFAEAEARGLASISLDGAFVDYPVALAARRVLAQAEAIAAAG